MGSVRCVCILWDGKQLHGLNASGRAPSAGRRITSRVQSAARARLGAPSRCPAPSAPGRRLSERFGKLPFEDLLQPGHRIAERGYAVPPVVQSKWAQAAQVTELVARAVC